MGREVASLCGRLPADGRDERICPTCGVPFYQKYDEGTREMLMGSHRATLRCLLCEVRRDQSVGNALSRTALSQALEKGRPSLKLFHRIISLFYCCVGDG